MITNSWTPGQIEFMVSMENNTKEDSMSDHEHNLNLSAGDELTSETKAFLNETRAKLKGHQRRQFMARVVSLLGRGGQLRAEKELGWDRKTIIKGTKEINSGITCIDNYSGRGRKPAEAHLPNLINDMKSIVNPVSQTDPTFRTTNLYSPITAKEVRRRLIEDKGYLPEEVPARRTISNKLNQSGIKLRKVFKSRPKKK
jgi:hypothetical protein